MQVSEQIIEVLNYLCEKVGIAIDWTSANILPQITEFVSRYATYNIVFHCVWIAISVIVLAVSGVLWRKMYKAYKLCLQKQESNFFFKYHHYCGGDEFETTYVSFVILFLTILLSFAFFIVLMGCTFSAIKWTLVPEFQIVEKLMRMMQ